MALSTIDTSSISGLGYGFKNRIINGGMVIDQRNAGASVTATTGIYTLDRWYCLNSVTSKYTVQQNAGSITPPAGFTNYLGVTSSAATSVGSTDYYVLRQAIEGVNCADLAWGTASAVTVTLSFKVYSSLTGTFGGAVQNNTSARSYPFSYTISSANTWTTISVTIPGDTSGTWQTGSSTGIFVYFGLGVGSTYSGTAGSWAGTNYTSATSAVQVVATNGATFYITGVQLEVGTVATSFDWRPYGTELALCQRYYQKSYPMSVVPATAYSGGTAGTYFGSGTSAVQAVATRFSIVMRSTPTVVLYDGVGTANRMQYYSGGWLNGSTVSYVGAGNESSFCVQAGSAGAYYAFEYTASSEL
jgi:hypothetical protein